MKKLVSLALLFVLAFGSMISKAQDSQQSDYERQKRNTQYVPPTSKAPVNVTGNHSILNLTNCPQLDRPTCLKEAFDTLTWTKCPMTFSTDGFRNDDGSSAAIPLPFNFNLYGTNYNQVFINNNGNLTFTTALATFTPFAFPSTPLAIVAPFFADVDTRNLASGVVWYKFTGNRLAVTWDSTGYFGSHADKLNTFQCIISDGLDPFLGLGNNVCFSYGDMEWTTGDASGGIGGFFGAPATVGINEGNGIDYATLGRFDRPGTYYGGPGVDSNGVSYLDCQNFCLNVSNVGNICPVAQNFPGGAVNITAGTPYVSQYAFTAPEVTQITSGGVTGVPPGMSVNITNGVTCTFDVSWNPSCSQAGTYQVCFSGIDNATVPCTTTVCVTYVVDCPLPVELSSFTSAVSGRDVSLNWSTASEENNARFEIERSSTENNWTKVGSVNGNGTTTNPHSYSFTDRGLASGNYSFRLKQVDFNGNFQYYNLSNEVVIGTPDNFSLTQNYPNPFNPSTKISYSIPSEGKVSLSIFDMTGKEVKSLVNSVQTAGYYSVSFDGSSLASGVYYYRVTVTGQNNFVATRKMLLVK
ncbi:MAG: T9SS type A sorting domain-containing protein [Ignavibacteria bacterium]|nr:T9SS type A sorting domain-containing protein [Ignavibacteria bacterium]